MDTKWVLRVDQLGIQYIVVAIREIMTIPIYSKGKNPQRRIMEDKRFCTGTEYVKAMYLYKSYEFGSEKDAQDEIHILERNNKYPGD